MKLEADAIKLDGSKAGSVELNDEIFGLEPRARTSCTASFAGSVTMALNGRHTRRKDTFRSELFHQEDLSPERYRWRTSRCSLCTDLPFGGGVSTRAQRFPVATRHDLTKKFRKLGS